MKVLLLVALVATMAFAVEGKSVSKKTQMDTKQLISLLKKMVLEEVSKKALSGDGSGDKAGSPYDSFDVIKNYLMETFPEDLDKPAFEVDHDNLVHALGAIVHIMASHIPEEMGPLALARSTQGLMDHMIHEGVNAVYELTGQLAYAKFSTMEFDVEEYEDKRTTVMKKSKNADRYAKAMEKLGKRSVQVNKKELAKRQEEGSGSGEYYCVYSAIYDAIVSKADGLCYDTYMLIAEHDPYYYGYMFSGIEYMAEDMGLLHESLGDVAQQLYWHLSTFLFQEPYDGTLPGPEIVGEIADKLDMMVEFMDGFEPENFATEMAALSSDIDREIFTEVVEIVSKCMDEVTPYIQYLVSSIRNEDYESVLNFFVGYAANVMSEQLELLGRVEEIVREGAKQKADVMGRLIDAISNGRGEDVMVAIFTKLAHNALKEGYQMDGFMMFAGELLDQVDRDMNPDAYGSGDFYAPPMGFRGRSGSSGSGASGASMKRFLKMIQH